MSPLTTVGNGVSGRNSVWASSSFCQSCWIRGTTLRHAAGWKGQHGIVLVQRGDPFGIAGIGSLDDETGDVLRAAGRFAVGHVASSIRTSVTDV